MPYDLEYLCGQLGQLTLLCPLPSPWASSASLLVRWGTEMSLALCKPFSETAIQHSWIFNTVFSTNPKHSLIPAKFSVKKIYSSPAQTSTSYSQGCGPRPAGVQKKRDLSGISGYCIVLWNFHYISFAYSVQTLSVQLITHLICLMSGHTVLAWDFNQSTGRILLKELWS